MSESPNENLDDTKMQTTERPSITLTGIVEKVIPSLHPAEPDKAQIKIEEADHLYREIRVANALHDENGNEVQLKQGSEVDVKIEASLSATLPKRGSITGGPGQYGPPL